MQFLLNLVILELHPPPPCRSLQLSGKLPLETKIQRERGQPVSLSVSGVVADKSSIILIARAFVQRHYVAALPVLAAPVAPPLIVSRNFGNGGPRKQENERKKKKKEKSRITRRFVKLTIDIALSERG